MSWKEWTDALGLPPIQDMVAGFSGGVVNAFVLRKVNAFEAVGSVFVGALTAGYLSDLARHLTGLSGGGVAFVVGLTGMAICQGLFEAARRWRPKFPGGGSEAKEPRDDSSP